MNKVKDADIELIPPPTKRPKIENTAPTPTTISLSKFLITPHKETKNSTIQLISIYFNKHDTVE